MLYTYPGNYFKLNFARNNSTLTVKAKPVQDPDYIGIELAHPHIYSPSPNLGAVTICLRKREKGSTKLWNLQCCLFVWCLFAPWIRDPR